MPSSVLYPHQVRALEKLYAFIPEGKFKGGYIAHSPGMGKTLTALTFARMVEAKRVLVLTNLTGTGVWQAEARIWWPQAQPLVWRNGHTPAYSRSTQFQGGRPVVGITNYDQLLSNNGKDLMKFLEKWKPDLLVLDEAQAIKTPTAQRTKLVKKLAKDIPTRLLLSGTPAHNPLDYWSQMQLVAPETWPWNMKFSEYKRYVANLGGPHLNWVVSFNKKRLEEVERALESHMDIATVDELQLPEPIISNIPIPLDPEERVVYDKMERELRIELDGQYIDAPVVLTKLMKLQQITGGYVLGDENRLHEVGRSKFDACIDLIEERENQKVIVACRFRHEITALHKGLGAISREHRMITGDTPAEERKEIEEWFQSTSNPAILLIQNQAGGISLTLTAADAMVLYSVDASTIVYQQVLGRVHRIGQTTHVQVMHLIADNTLDGDLIYALRQKLELVDIAKVLRRGIQSRGR